MRDTAAGDHGFDAKRPHQAPVFVVVVTAVAKDAVGSLAWPSHQAGDGRNFLQQGRQLGHVVTAAAGQRDGERDALAVDDDVVFAARTCAVDRTGTAFGPRRAALTWEESITARDQSSFFATRSFLSSTWCSWSHTPASFHAARRRQHVMPEPKPSSCGRYSHWIPVCNTNRMPQSACRSGTRGRPSACFGAGSGSNGSMSDHSSSDTIHGRGSVSPRPDQRPSTPRVT